MRKQWLTYIGGAILVLSCTTSVAVALETQLTVSSSVGGTVTSPGEGTFQLNPGQFVDIQATPVQPDLFQFTGWTGTAVEFGLVTDPQTASTTAVVIGQLTLHANFHSTLNTLIVDDDAPHDPAPGDGGTRDPLENGTAERPFDTIREALGVTGPNASIHIRAGTYQENLVLNRHVRALTAVGVAEDRPCIVDGNDRDPVLQFPPDSNCVVSGLTLIRGRGTLAGGVECQGAYAQLVNCVVAGCRADDLQGAAVYAADSNLALTHCTVADNLAGAAGASLRLVNSRAEVRNSILWNGPPREIATESGSLATVMYSDVAGGWSTGSGNMNSDPLFVQNGSWVDQGLPAMTWIAGNYHLKTTSPVINWGQPGTQPAMPVLDIDGQNRVSNGRADMGADEVQGGGTVPPPPPPDPPSNDHFLQDLRLKEAVEDALGILDPTESDMLGLLELDASFRNISSIAGLQYATNLWWLDLQHNRLRRVDELATLTNLKILTFDNNRVADLSPVSSLVNLQDLDFHENEITDLSPLVGLTKLTHLRAYRQDILSDLSPLASMPQLVLLELYRNNISDISPLTSLTSLQELNLLINPLGDTACNTHLPLIEANNPGITLLAHCGPLELTLTSTAGGSIVTPGEGSFFYEFGTLVQIVAQADAGYVFDGYTGNQSGSNPSMFVKMISNMTIQANFVPDNP